MRPIDIRGFALGAVLFLIGVVCLGQTIGPRPAPSSTTPSGPAGGDLSGTYPNPTVTNGSNITNASIPSSGLASVITAAGPVGSATVTPIVTYNAAGQLTTVSSATITPAVGSITGLGTGIATALGINVGTAGSPVTNGGALGTPSSGTVTNLTGTASININGTVGATTAATGKFTNATIGAGSAITSSGAGGALGSGAFATVPTGVWTSYTPTITCGTGAVGSYSRQNGSFEQIGKLTVFQVDVQAALGTCSTTITISTPAAAFATQRQVVSGIDFTTSIVLSVLIGAGGGSAAAVTTVAGANPTGSDNFVIGGSYQSQ